MSDREISAIHVDGGLYGLKDAVARAQQTTFKIFDAEPFKADLSVVKLSAEDYEQLVSGGNAVSNVLYIVEGEDEDMYGQRVKNVGWPTDLSDAATKLYVDSAVSAARVDHIEDSVNSISANLSYSASFPVSAAFEFTNGDGQTFVLTSDDGVDFLYEEAGVKKIDLGYYADCWNYSEYYWDNDNDQWQVDAYGGNNEAGPDALVLNFDNHGGSARRPVCQTGKLARVSDLPTKTSQLSNDSGFLSAVPDTYALKSDVKMSYYSAARKIVLSAGSNQTSVDCNDFIKDGMLSSAQLCGTVLVLKFNTDAGSAPISVELSNFVDDYDQKITYLSNSVDVRLRQDVVCEEWDSSQVYRHDEIVSHKGLLWTARINNPTEEPGTDETEWISVGLDAVLSTKYQAKGNYLTAVPNTYKTYADTKGSLSADGYLTAVPDTYKTYADTKTSLSDDGYALASQQVSVDAALSVQGAAADAKVVGDALRGGFTEWEFSDGLGHSMSIEEYNGVWRYSLDGFIDSMEAFASDTDALAALSLTFVGDNTITATRHLITPTKTSQLSNDSGFLSAHQSLSNYYQKSETSSASEISAALSAKAGVVVKTAGLSSRLSDLVINDVTREEYIALSAAGQTVSSELYLVRPDTAQLDAHGDWVVNVKSPELSSDAATKAYVDSQLSNAGGGFSFERYWPEYNSAAQTYVLKPGKFNILSVKINPGDNLVLEDYTPDNVYKVQLTGYQQTSAALNILVDTNAGDVLPGAYRDDAIASCLTVVAPRQVYNFEVSYGSLTIEGDYNGDALRTLYPFPAGSPIYGQTGYDAYGVMPLDNACNHLSVGPGEEYNGKTFHVVIPGRVRTNKVRRMRRFSIMLRDEFAERGMQFQFPNRDVNNGQVQYTFVCGSQYAQNPKQGDVVIFDEYQKDRFYVDVKNVDQNVWYQFTTPTPSEGVVAMRDRCVNYVNIKATASVTWEWSDGDVHAPPYYDEGYDPPGWVNNGDSYEIINYDAGPNAEIIYAYPDPNDHDESTIIVAQKVTSYVTQNGVIQMPPQNPGKCRDFLLRLRVDQDPPPNITFSGGSFESESGEFPEIETGVQVLAFTETKTNTFMVSSKVLTKIT